MFVKSPDLIFLEFDFSVPNDPQYMSFKRIFKTSKMTKKLFPHSCFLIRILSVVHIFSALGGVQRSTKQEEAYNGRETEIKRWAGAQKQF